MRVGVHEVTCCPAPAGRGNGAVEIPWWTYGARGMQLWFPSALAEPVSPGAAADSRYATDPELEFDREVYPVGISLSEVSIIGAVLLSKCRSLCRGAALQPCSHPGPSLQKNTIYVLAEYQICNQSVNRSSNFGRKVYHNGILCPGVHHRQATFCRFGSIC